MGNASPASSPLEAQTPFPTIRVFMSWWWAKGEVRYTKPQKNLASRSAILLAFGP